MPPEYPLRIRSAANVSSNRSNSSVARSREALRPMRLSSPINARFCRPVKAPSRVASWAATPIRRRTSFAWVAMSKPATMPRPRSGVARVVRIRTAVVLPAPFGPSRPRIDPEGTAKSTPANACVSPYALARPWASIMFRGAMSFLTGRLVTLVMVRHNLPVVK
jgi:hypothetical protein